jgi:hypothetical protein
MALTFVNNYAGGTKQYLMAGPARSRIMCITHTSNDVKCSNTEGYNDQPYSQTF